MSSRELGTSGEEAGKSARGASGPGERRGKEEGEELGSAKGHEMKRPASLAAAILFWLIALAQLLRVLLRVRVTAGSHDVPLWLSAVAFVVLGALGLWLWRERRE
jgi:hypothetical protein